MRRIAPLRRQFSGFIETPPHDDDFLGAMTDRRRKRAGRSFRSATYVARGNVSVCLACLE